MKTKRYALLAFAFLSTFIQQTPSLFAQGTAFTYQGQLIGGGNPANGLYDFRFKLYADPFSNTQIGASYLSNGIPVTNGLFTTTIDFGAGIFTGGTNWLEVGVKTNGANSYFVLAPLQRVTPTPNAIFATTAANVSGTVLAGQIGGTISNSSLPASPNFSGTVAAVSFTGNGANVTNVNAAALNGLNATNFWQLGGNNVAAGQIFGSTNNQPVEIWVNNQRTFRFEPNTNTPNIIGGWPGNFAAPGVVMATIGGGGGASIVNSGLFTNSVWGSYGTVSGGIGNQAGDSNGTPFSARGATVAGGGVNSAGSAYSTISGGSGHTIFLSSDYSYIGGGAANSVLSNASYGSISGGYNNQIVTNATGATISGGFGNNASGPGAVIGGGGVISSTNGQIYYTGNQAGGISSVVPGGIGNIANGDFSFAAGYLARVMHQGTFVWADDSIQDYFTSTGSNQFLVRATGGVGINTNNPGAAALSVNGSITSPMWRVTWVINTNGPLNLTNSFITGGGTLLITASGSGYSTPTGGFVGMNIVLDGVTNDSCQIFANSANMHLSFVPKTIVVKNIAAGSHKLALQSRTGTVTDTTDNYSVTVQELPF